MIVDMEACPCSGKSMSNLAAPWILLTLFRHHGTHGYEIKKIIQGYVEDFSMEMNITGLYRHLNTLEKRGMLSSEWDVTDKGPAKRRYSLTEPGKECLWRWLNTLSTQALLIGRFFDRARELFPASTLPIVQLCDHPGTGSPSEYEKRDMGHDKK
jgi:DNA-binding PadR family transcriptional regulator